jgi:hypothetical protein
MLASMRMAASTQTCSSMTGFDNVASGDARSRGAESGRHRQRWTSVRGFARCAPRGVDIDDDPDVELLDAPFLSPTCHRPVTLVGGSVGTA